VIKTYRKLFALLDDQERRNFWWLAVVMLLVAAAEIAGFSAVLMLLNIISAPEKIAQSTFVQRRRERKVAAGYVDELRIKTSSSAENIENLSGGNQQKVLFARALFSDPNIIIVDEPTQGIDVGAKTEVYRLIRDFVARGRSVIVISSELPELLGLSDRVIVMREGRKAGEIVIPLGAAGDQAAMADLQRRVMALATGGGNEQ